MSAEVAVTFRCGTDGLLGILHEPGASSRDTGVLVVVGGPQYRVGSHRQFVLMARHFAAAGYPTLRFDYRGMGDSTGAARGFEAVDEDIRAALDELQRRCPALRRIVIFGLCDAASAALMYCAGDARLAGLILVNPWVRTEAGEAATYVRHYYWRRIASRAFWEKLLRGELRIFESVKSLGAMLGKAFGGARDAGQGSGAHFIDRMRRGFATFSRPVLLLLSERDLTAREFEQTCRAAPEWSAVIGRGNVTTVRLPRADHTFSSSQSLRAATTACLEWLEALQTASAGAR